RPFRRRARARAPARRRPRADPADPAQQLRAHDQQPAGRQHPRRGLPRLSAQAGGPRRHGPRERREMTSGALLSARPRLRPEICIGPPLVAGKAVVHHLKDPRTGWYFRVGAREYFVISRLDGERTIADIGDEYTREFGKRLQDAHWQQILGLLGGRRLLAGTEDPQVLAELAESARRGGRGGQNLLLYRRPLVNPDRLLGWLEPRLRFAFSPWFVVPAAAAILAMLADMAVRWHAVYSDTRH